MTLSPSHHHSFHQGNYTTYCHNPATATDTSASLSAAPVPAPKPGGGGGDATSALWSPPFAAMTSSSSSSSVALSPFVLSRSSNLGAAAHQYHHHPQPHLSGSAMIQPSPTLTYLNFDNIATENNNKIDKAVKDKFAL
jgi:hypothetical protein